MLVLLCSIYLKIFVICFLQPYNGYYKKIYWFGLIFLEILLFKWCTDGMFLNIRKRQFLSWYFKIIFYFCSTNVLNIWFLYCTRIIFSLRQGKNRSVSLCTCSVLMVDFHIKIHRWTEKQIHKQILEMKCHWAFSSFLWFIPQSSVKMALIGCCVQKSNKYQMLFIPVQSLPFQIAGWANQENLIIYKSK